MPKIFGPTVGGKLEINKFITCNPALAERETALAFALPESLPALPPA